MREIGSGYEIVCVHARARVCVCECVRACHECVRSSVCAHACVRAGVRACMRACARACVCTYVRACRCGVRRVQYFVYTMIIFEVLTYTPLSVIYGALEIIAIIINTINTALNNFNQPTSDADLLHSPSCSHTRGSMQSISPTSVHKAYSQN